ncbi:MAG TPA: hypothetical protein EYP94_06330 [Gammaproteobacteria bacterium]|jgi:tetratricopeptide (TPR) repeat protein|nr:hypothetical protein [Gammaproteobacteria bacterium]
MFGFGKKKNKCRNEALQSVNEFYYEANATIALKFGHVDMPEGYSMDDVDNSLIMSVNAITPLLSQIVNCEAFTEQEGVYWSGHLNQFGAFLLRNAGDVESAKAYYEASIINLNLLESEAPYPYIEIPSILDDVQKYTWDTSSTNQKTASTLYVRRMLTSLISSFGDEEATKLEIEKNIETSRNNFKNSQDCYITVAETIWQAGEFYSIAEPEKAMKLYQEAVEAFEKKSDLKTEMENGILNLLKYKLSILRTCESLDTVRPVSAEYEKEIFSEISEYEDLFEKATYSIDTEDLYVKGFWSCSKVIQKKISEIHSYRNYLEKNAHEYEDDDSAKLVEESLIDIDNTLDEITKCKEIDDYWKAHLTAFKGYIYARKSDNESSGKFYKKALKLLEKLDENRPFEIPDDAQEAITSISGGYVFNSVIAELGFVTSIEDQSKADKEFLKLVDKTEKIAPNNENGALVTVLRKTGERFSFPFRQDSKDLEVAKSMFEKGINFMENKAGLSLEESINNHDTSLLFFKDYLRINLEYLGESEKATSIESEIEPYSEYIYWHFEF